MPQETAASKKQKNYSASEIQWVQTPTGKLAVHKSGKFSDKTSPLVLIHGNGGDFHEFDRLAALFGPERPLIMPDTRAHGRSDFGVTALSFPLLAEDLKLIADSLGLKKFSIIGFSDGGNLALQFALKYSDYVDSMVLAGANLNPSGLSLKIRIMDIAVFLAQSIAGLFSKNWRKKAAITYLMIGHPKMTLSQLKSLKIPVLVMAGENDMILEAHTVAIAKALPVGRLKIIPKENHFFIVKNPSSAFNLISDFLGLKK